MTIALALPASATCRVCHKYEVAHVNYPLPGGS
jgi:hypothetical protein